MTCGSDDDRRRAARSLVLLLASAVRRQALEDANTVGALLVQPRNAELLAEAHQRLDGTLDEPVSAAEAEADLICELVVDLFRDAPFDRNRQANLSVLLIRARKAGLVAVALHAAITVVAFLRARLSKDSNDRNTLVRLVLSLLELSAAYADSELFRDRWKALIEAADLFDVHSFQPGDQFERDLVMMVLEEASHASEKIGELATALKFRRELFTREIDWTSSNRSRFIAMIGYFDMLTRAGENLLAIKLLDDIQAIAASSEIREDAYVPIALVTCEIRAIRAAIAIGPIEKARNLAISAEKHAKMNYKIIYSPLEAFDLAEAYYLRVQVDFRLPIGQRRWRLRKALNLARISAPTKGADAVRIIEDIMSLLKDL